MRAGRGWTLIELVVVLGLLAAVGFVTAISVGNVLDRNESRRAGANAQSVALAQQRFAVRYGTYTGYPADLGAVEDVTVITGESRNPDEVSIALGADGTVGLAVRETAPTCRLYRLNDAARGGGAEELDVTEVGARPLCAGVSALPDGEAEADGGRPVSKAW